MTNRRNIIYILITLCIITGLFTGQAFLFNMAYVFGALLILSFLWAWLSVRWVTLGRKTRARRAQVGRKLSEIFMVRNRGYLPKLWLEVIDESDLPNHRASHVVPALNGRASYRWNVETPCIARGEFRLGPMKLTSGDPFGLFISTRKIDATSRVIIYPATPPIDKFELPMGLLSGGEAQRRRSHYVTTNASGVRDYVSGDSFNRIHWRSSARKDQLIVKEFEIDPLVDIWLFADFSQSSLVESPHLKRIEKTGAVIPTSNAIPMSTEEYGVVITAALSKHFIDIERALGFVAYAPHREVHHPERGNRQLTRILETLAVTRSFSPYSLGQMITLETPYFTRGTTLVMVTASTDPNWVEEVQILNRRGIQTMCIYIDPKTFGGNISSDEMKGLLRIAKIPTIVVKYGDDLTTALGQRPTI